MSECPADWTREPGSGVCVPPYGRESCRGEPPACVPLYPSETCTGATMARVGHADCQPVGTCSPGRWPEPQGDRPFLFVDATAAEGGDGSTDRPYRSLGHAVEMAPTGAAVLVAAGEYQTHLQISGGRRIDIIGACAGSVVLRPAADIHGVLVERVSELRLRGVTLRGYLRAIDLLSQAKVVLEEVVIEDSELDGLRSLATAQLTIRDSVMRGRGVRWQFGRLEIERSHLDGLVGSAVRVFGESARVRVVDSVVSDVRAAPADEGGGFGVFVGGNARCEITGSVITGAQRLALFAIGQNTELTVHKSALVGGAGARGHRGVEVQEKARVVLDRVQLAGFDDSAVFVPDAGSEAVLQRTAIRDLRAPADAQMRQTAMGVFVRNGGLAELDAVAIEEVEGIAARVQGAESRLEIRSSWVAQRGIHAYGIDALQGGTLIMADTTVQGAALVGVGIHHRQSSFEGTRIVLRNARGSDDPEDLSGIGLLVMDEAQGTLRDSRLTGNRSFGAVTAGLGSALTITRARIDSNALDKLPVAGLAVLNGASATLDSTLIEDNGAHGIAAQGDTETSLSLNRCLVRGTRGVTHEGVQHFGDGVSMTREGSLVMSESLVTGNRRVGVLAQGGADAYIEGSRISNNTIGVHSSEGSDVGREVVLDESAAVFSNHEHNFDAMRLPVPTIAAPTLLSEIEKAPLVAP